MSDTGFLERLTRLRVHRLHNQRAPNKPLLLLYGLGRIARNEPRLVEYRDAEPAIKGLLVRFGLPRRVQHPELAYSHLCNDGLWEVPKSDRIARTATGAFLISGLRPHGAGGFPAEIDEELRADPALVDRAIQQVLDGFFAPSLHDDIRSAIGVPPRLLPDRRPRDPHFRLEVLRAYAFRCAVCSYDIRMDDDLLGLEAAHIRAHCDGGPDRVDNGLALCTLHHKALDRGAVGLSPAQEGEFLVMVSKSVHGTNATAGLILDYHGKAIRSPHTRDERPNPEYVKWHTEQVFRDPPIAA